MFMYLFSVVVTCLVFGYAGYLLSKKYRRKINNMVLIPFIVLSFILFYVGVGMRVFSFFSFSIMLNQVLGVFFSGFTIGLFVRMRKAKIKA
jgi:putative effector of murein hydrolase